MWVSKRMRQWERVRCCLLTRENERDPATSILERILGGLVPLFFRCWKWICGLSLGVGAEAE